jgi:ElaB/YqjD/DUF883 family membrane-anchored ribosome-binding protein
MPDTATTSHNERSANSTDRASHSDRKNIERVAERAEGAANSVASAARDYSGNLIQGAKEYAENASEMAKKKYHEAEETVKEQSDALVEYVKEQPVKSLLFAAGAGYLLSYLLCRK